MKKEVMQKILIDTQKGYDTIAEKFSQTRKRFWGNLEFLKEYAHSNDIVLDYGCGNGRLLELIGETQGIRYEGIDPSQALLERAQARYQREHTHFSKLELGQGTIPFQDEFFNAVYSIAVLHHIPGRETRESLAQELFRLTKPGGHVVITVWNIWQKKYVKKVYLNWLKKLFFLSPLDWNDCYISFSDNKGNRFQRYHHAFREHEMQILFEGAGFSTMRCEIVDGKNLVYIGKKKSRE